MAGVASARDMLYVLMKKRETCDNELAVAPPPLDDEGNPLTTYCQGEWDKLYCWPNSAPGPVYVKCPDYIVDFNHDGVAKRHCAADGEWHLSLRENKTWVDYSECSSNMPPEEELKERLEHGAPHLRSMIELYTVGYSVSLVFLVVAMFILAYFRKLHCTRNYIHMHLFVSFILRGIIIFVKDAVLFNGSGILDMNSQSTEMSLEALMDKMDSPPGRKSYLTGCKFVMALFHYFLATNYFWILVEALYLHSLIFVAFFTEEKYLWKFIMIGWGAPLLFVVPWVIVRAMLDQNQCWDISITEYKWIYNGPIVVASVINFLLFLNIIRVLWYKMRERGAIKRADNRGRFRYRKLAKSTLVLIPMFGVHAIIFIGMPDNVTQGFWWKTRMYFDLFFNSFQGFFVAIIYCFCNGEVQAEFKKSWERFNLSVEMQRGNRERSRSSVTMLTNFNSSGSQQPRLSNAGQGYRCGPSTLRAHSMTTNNQSLSSPSGGVGGFAAKEFRAPLLEQEEPAASANRNVKYNGKEDILLTLGDDEHLAPFATYESAPKAPAELVIPQALFVHVDDFEERAFELAMEPDEEENRISTNLSREGSANSSSNSSSNRNSTSEVDSDISKCGRTPSFDSGISSVMGGTRRLSAGFTDDTKRGEDVLDVTERL